VRTGEKVTKLTKKVGQAAPVGRVVALRGESVEVRWEDGHTSLISRIGLVPVKNK
jgi:hypothetical protein